MGITAAQVKELRMRTGLGIMECKTALTETGGHMDNAVEVLRKKGHKTAELRKGREASEGLIGQYVHTNGRIGTLVELNCETDFVARSDDFRALVSDLCMQVAATNPAAVTREQIPRDVVEKEKDICRAQMADAMKNKPPHVQEKILEGKLTGFYKEACLLDQPFVRDPKKTVQQRVDEVVAKVRENIVVRRFVRLELGKE